jgi:hypothetical protein
VHHIEQVARAPGEAIELGDHDDVALSNLGEQLLQGLAAVDVLACHFLADYFLATGSAQGVNLAIETPGFRADASISVSLAGALVGVWVRAGKIGARDEDRANLADDAPGDPGFRLPTSDGLLGSAALVRESVR